MNKSKYFLLFYVLLGLLSCRKENSEKVDQDDIWARYRVIYRSDLGSTYLRANFRHNNSNGENLRLSSNSSLTFNGEKPNYIGSFISYEIVMNSRMDEVDFVYSDIEGNVFENNVKISGIELPEIDTLYSDSVIFIPWIGDSLTENEIVYLYIEGNNAYKLPFIKTDTIGSTGVYLNPNNIADLDTQEVTIHFERHLINEVNGTSAGGISQGLFISKNKKVQWVVD